MEYSDLPKNLHYPQIARYLSRTYEERYEEWKLCAFRHFEDQTTLRPSDELAAWLHSFPVNILLTSCPYRPYSTIPLLKAYVTKIGSSIIASLEAQYRRPIRFGYVVDYERRPWVHFHMPIACKELYPALVKKIVKNVVGSCSMDVQVVHPDHLGDRLSYYLKMANKTEEEGEWDFSCLEDFLPYEPSPAPAQRVPVVRPKLYWGYWDYRASLINKEK